MGNLNTGLLLMVVGMITVFCILLIVIYGSRALISLVNKIAPAGQPSAKAQAGLQGPDPRTVSVLEAAVAQLTGGKGHISKITSVN